VLLRDHLGVHLRLAGAETMRVLVVEDDPAIASFVARALREQGYGVDEAHDGTEGLALARQEQYDAAVVDVMLPGRDGLALVQQLRREGVSMPVLVLTAKRSVDDRVRGLQVGADDYLTKPFALAELLARVHALVRRATGLTDTGQLLVADLTLNRLTRRVERQGRAIDLRPREFALLELLMRNAGRVVSKAMILSHVWGFNFDPGSNVVDVLVFRLRDKIDRGFSPPLLQTVRGVGYVLREGDGSDSETHRL
jgi:two-component system OmpR family response regulator